MGHSRHRDHADDTSTHALPGRGPGDAERSHSGTKSVLVVYPFLQHYRRGVFLELDQIPGLRFTFAADTGGREGIASMEPDELTRFHRIHTRRFLRAEIQTGLARVMMRNFDSIIFYGDAASLSTWIAAAYARLKGIEVYFWTIGWHRPESGLKRGLRLAFYRLSHRLLVYGNIAREIGIQMGFPGDRISVIGNSITLEPGSPSREQPLMSATDSGAPLIVGAVARLNHVKRFDLLVDACGIIRRRGINIQIRLAGTGPCRDRLELQANQESVPIDFVGPIYSGPALAAFYSGLNVTVVPQAIGLTAIQSMGYGVPAISDDNVYSQMPEWEAIVPGGTGDTYNRGDSLSLADSILRVAAAQSAHAEMHQACRAEYVTRWSPSVHANNIARVLLS